LFIIDIIIVMVIVIVMNIEFFLLM